MAKESTMATTYPPDRELKSATETLDHPVGKPSAKSVSDRLMYAWSFDDHDDTQVQRAPQAQEPSPAHAVNNDECPPEAYLG